MRVPQQQTTETTEDDFRGKELMGGKGVMGTKSQRKS